MSINPRTSLALLVAATLAGCGDKLPQSGAAKKIGEQPRQIIDKAAADVNKALQQGIEQRQQAENKE